MVLWNQKSIPNHSLSSNLSTDLIYSNIKQVDTIYYDNGEL